MTLDILVNWVFFYWENCLNPYNEYNELSTSIFHYGDFFSIGFAEINSVLTVDIQT